MNTNLGTTDRMLRIVAGFVMIALTLWGAIGAWGWLGIVPLVTGLMAHCPVYSILGMDTCHPKQVS